MSSSCDYFTELISQGYHFAVENIADLDVRREGCPKRMVFGPCGGVRTGGRCEVDDHPCPFVETGLVRWNGPRPSSPSAATGPGGLRQTMARRPVVVTDFRARPFDRASATAVATVLGRCSDAVLIGEHQARPDFPPTMLAGVVTDAGAAPWVTLTCRDRNRVVLEGELEGLAAMEIPGVHCVTGDGRDPRADRHATQVFDLDSFRLVALAREAGLDASVAATPVAPPIDLRAARIVEKERAGATLCFVNHSGGPAAVAQFVAASREAGATIPFIACVPVFTDQTSAAVLAAFPGLSLDPLLVQWVLRSPDPVAAGVAAAVEQAEAMVAIEGVEGVDLSGSATSGPESESAAIMAAVGSQLLERWGSRP